MTKIAGFFSISKARASRVACIQVASRTGVPAVVGAGGPLRAASVRGGRDARLAPSSL